MFVTVVFPVITGKRWVFLFALAAMLHEFGHLAALWLLGARMERLSLRLSGAEIGYRGELVLEAHHQSLDAKDGEREEILCELYRRAEQMRDTLTSMKINHQ